MRKSPILKTNYLFYKSIPFLFLFLIFLYLVHPLLTYASFIESTIGTAVVNDATATLYNPAALTIIKNTQFISLNSLGQSTNQFSGTFFQSATNFTQTGISKATTHYFLPSIYVALPTSHNISLGMGFILNSFSRDIDENSILRYSQSGNKVQNYDFVPALGIKINRYFSIGGGINFSKANFILKPITGFPTLNIPDSQSKNEARGTGVGGDIGLLINPSQLTLLGFNYRSAITYRLSGKSILHGKPNLISNNYAYNFWTPARIVFSVNQTLTKSLGLIGTLQRIKWSIFNTIPVKGIAVKTGTRQFITNATIPFHLRDSWLLTLGTHYRLAKQWVVRIAGSYNQSNGNPRYQITNGDSFVAGMSVGYEVIKNLTLDASYAHAFIQNKTIYINQTRNSIKGINTGRHDSISAKVTFNLT